MQKDVGIWLDQKEAYIISLEREEEKILKIESEIENFHLNGGYGSATKYKAQDTVSETKLQERKKHQLHNYYERIIEKLANVDGIYIFGLADAKIGLKDSINHSSLKNSLRAVETTDKMTVNQMRAKVRTFFASN